MILSSDSDVSIIHSLCLTLLSWFLCACLLLWLLLLLYVRVTYIVVVLLLIWLCHAWFRLLLKIHLSLAPVLLIDQLLASLRWLSKEMKILRDGTLGIQLEKEMLGESYAWLLIRRGIYFKTCRALSPKVPASTIDERRWMIVQVNFSIWFDTCRRVI